jgi:hypothetical protein
MGFLDRVRNSASDDANGTEGESTSAESGGEVSEAGSSFGNAQTGSGGADAVPDTPDTVEEDYT